MNRPEKVIYKHRPRFQHHLVGAVGYRAARWGRANWMDVTLSRPVKPWRGTNPEQLFAAGWAALLNQSAMETRGSAGLSSRWPVLTSRSNAEVDLCTERRRATILRSAELQPALPSPEKKKRAQGLI